MILSRSFASASRLLAWNGPSLTLIAALFTIPPSAPAQAETRHAPVIAIASNQDALLPDAPEPQAQSGTATTDSGHPTSTANKIQAKLGLRLTDPKAIEPFQEPLRLTAGDKMKLSFLQQLTPLAFATMFVASGWEQWMNSNPKYGSDSTAFAQRLGAAAARQTSQAVFSDGVYAVIFRQDPRYYRLTTGSVGKRILYAASRTWRTRSDDGTPQYNYSLLLGHATAQALTLAYYPDRSQNGRVAVTGFAWSLGGSMLGNQYHEFWPDIVKQVFRHSDTTP